MTTLVAQLVDLGFAERRADPDDLRVVLVAITSAGRHQLGTMRRTSRVALTTFIDRLSEAETATLRAAVPAIVHLVELAAEGPPL
jgi:DNA-binding MarR family transcriptional regulator